MAPLLWCEARCHYGLSSHIVKHEDDKPCRETAPGDFGVRDAKIAAANAGWLIIGGEWCCPNCQRAARASLKPPTGDSA